MSMREDILVFSNRPELNVDIDFALDRIARRMKCIPNSYDYIFDDKTSYPIDYSLTLHHANEIIKKEMKKGATIDDMAKKYIKEIYNDEI